MSDAECLFKGSDVDDTLTHPGSDLAFKPPRRQRVYPFLHPSRRPMAIPVILCIQNGWERESVCEGHTCLSVSPLRDMTLADGQTQTDRTLTRCIIYAEQ